jgi:uncharacterized membrane protein YeaQ/YmgE (transglycosylase-associated protein family)
MGILAWVVLGGIAGWLASIVAGTNAKMGIPSNIVVGVVGAVAGGYIFNFFGHAGVTGFNLYSLGVSFVGATVMLFIFRRVIR